MSNQNKIGVATATIVGMNAMIGAGIFGIPAALASAAGPAGILTTLFVAFAVWFLASSLARLAFLYPQEGSFYNYAKQWGGHTMGLISSGAYLVGLIIAMGLLAQVSGIYLQHYFPSMDTQTLGFIALMTLVLLNAIGLVISELGQYVLIVCTVTPLVVTSIMCLTKINLANLTPFAPFGILSAIKATRVVIFAFFGFECAASLFSIVKDPEKNVPKALTYSLILVSILYMLFVSGLILSTPLSIFSDPSMPISTLLMQVFPKHKWVIELIHFSTLSAILGTIHSMIWGSSSLLLSFVKSLKNKCAQSLISKNLLNSKTSVLLIGAFIFTSFAALKNLNLFFNLTAIFIVFAYSTSIITLLTLKSEWKNKENIKTVIGLATALLIWSFAIEGLIKEISKIV